MDEGGDCSLLAKTHSLPTKELEINPSCRLRLRGRQWLGNCNTAQACIFLSADRAPSAYSTTRAASIFDLWNLWLPRAGLWAGWRYSSTHQPCHNHTYQSQQIGIVSLLAIIVAPWCSHGDLLESCRSVRRGLVSASKIRWKTCKICIKPTNTAHRLNSTLIITDFCLKNLSNEARPPRLYDQSFYPPISPSSPRLHSSNTNQFETVLIRLKFWLSTPAVNLVARGREAQQSKLD